MQRSCFELSILVNGKPLREYFHNDRYYVEGRDRSEFELFLRNNSGRQVEAIFSVDGLDVLDGKRANAKKTGYLVYPGQQIRIPGWRLSNDEVAHFVFSGLEDSYASSKGKKRNIGVIGVAIYYEKELYNWNQYNIQNINWIPQPNQSGILRGQGFGQGTSSPMPRSVEIYCQNASNQVVNTSGEPSITCSIGNTMSVENTSSKEVHVTQHGLGTGFGRKADFKVNEVSFTRASSTPAEVLEMRYNDRSGLEKLGIKVGQPLPEETSRRETAKPFEDIGGCEPPQDWKY